MDSLSLDLIHSYHASNGGRRPFNPGELNNLSTLLEKGYVEVTICNEDGRSPHKAKTCRQRLAWLTDRGLEVSERLIARIVRNGIHRVDEYLEHINERVSSILRYWILVSLYPNLDYLRHTQYLTLGELMNYMPRVVEDRRAELERIIVESGLATYTCRNHTVKGWKGREFAVEEGVKAILASSLGAPSLPLVADIAAILLAGLRNEHSLALETYLERGLTIFDYYINLERLDHPILKVATIYGYVSNDDLSLRIKESEPINEFWLGGSMRVHSRYYRSTDRWIVSLPVNVSMAEYEVYQASRSRLEKTEELVRSILETWINEGKVNGLDIPPLELAPHRILRQRV